MRVLRISIFCMMNVVDLNAYIYIYIYIFIYIYIYILSLFFIGSVTSEISIF
jgi:hypothetical protein